jgi:hypothetical protein
MGNHLTSPRVPRLAVWLLHCVLPSRDRDAVLGDLYEEYGIRATASVSAATRWYWGQVCRSVPSLVLATARRGRWLLTISIALAAYVVVGTINVAGTALVARLLDSPAATSRVSGMFVGLTAIAAGGYIAAWIRPAAAIMLGALVAIVAVVLMVSPSDTAPLWYQLTFLVCGPLAAAAGRTLRVGRRPPWSGW